MVTDLLNILRLPFIRNSIVPSDDIQLSMTTPAL